MVAETCRAFAGDTADPMQRLDIMYERWSIKNTDLRDLRGTMTRQTALALNAFDHGAFFTANISACASAEIDIAGFDNAIGFELCNFFREDMQDRRIFIPHVNESRLCLDRPRGNEHSFEKSMRFTFEEIAVFKCTGLAFITIYSKIPRSGFGADERPFFS